MFSPQSGPSSELPDLLQIEFACQPKPPGYTQIGSKLECTICLDVFKDPRILPCGHTFCLQCLKNLAEDGKFILCPNDRKKIRLPPNGAEGVLQNFAVAGALADDPKHASFAADERSSFELGICSECLGHKSLQTCTHCEQNLCYDCRQLHYYECKIKLKKWRQELQRSSAALKTSPSGPNTDINNDKRHVESVKQNITEMTSNALKRIKDVLVERKEALCAEIDRLELDRNVHNLGLRAEQKELMKSGKDAMDHIDKWCSESTTSLPPSSMKAIETIIQQLAGKIAACENMRLRSVQDVDFRCSVSEMDRGIDSICERLSELLAVDLVGTAGASSPTVQSPSSGVAPVVQVEHIHETQQTPGDVGGGDVDVEHLGNAGGHEPAPNKDRWNVFSPASGECFSDPCGIAVSNGEIYVTDSKSKQILHFDARHRFKKSFRDLRLKLPTRIAVNLDGFLLVADRDNHQIQIFDPVRGRYIGGRGRRGTIFRCFREPLGVGVDSTTGNAYVCDFKNDRLQALDHEMQHLLVQPFAQEEFPRPMDVSIQSGVVAVSCWANDSIYIHSTNGQKILSIRDGFIKSPMGVALSKDGNKVYVCSESGIVVYAIVVSDNETRYACFREVIKTPFPDSRPKSIALLSRTEVIVSLVDRKQLYVLSIPQGGEV